MSVYEEIKQFQLDIDTVIAGELHEFEFIRNYLNTFQGKRLRSQLYWYACKTLGETPSAKIAAAFEILHQATLMHDDVLDNADIRRNISTISAEKGNNFSILTGDILLSSCMKLIAKEHSFRLINLFSELAANLIRGELRCQSMSLSTDLQEYKQNVYLKTGCFFEIIMKSIRHRNNDLVRFGREFGIFFQMADDYKDYFCAENETGKKQFQDLISRTTTFPIIIAYKYANQSEKEKIRNFFSGNDSIIEAIIAIVKKNKIEAAKILESQKQKAIDCLIGINETLYVDNMLQIINTAC